MLNLIKAFERVHSQWASFTFCLSMAFCPLVLKIWNSSADKINKYNIATLFSQQPSSIISLWGRRGNDLNNKMTRCRSETKPNNRKAEAVHSVKIWKRLLKCWEQLDKERIAERRQVDQVSWGKRICTEKRLGEVKLKHWELW